MSDTPPRDVRGAAPTPLRRLVPAIMLSQLGFYIALLTPVQLLLTLRLTELSAPAAVTINFSLVTGVGALVALISNPIAGRVSDRTRLRFGRRRTSMLLGALAGSGALIGLGLANEIWQVVVLWALVQAVFNFQYAATNALVSDQVPAARRGGVSGLVGLTIAVGPLIGLVMTEQLRAGSKDQWWALAIAAAALAIVAVLLLRDTPASGEPARMSLRDVANTFWLDPRRHSAFAWAWLVRFLITCTFASGSYNALYLLQHFNTPTDKVGSIVLELSLVLVGCLVISSVVAGYLSDRMQRQKPFVVASGVLSAIALLMMGFAPSLSFVFVASVVLGLSTGMFFAVDLAMCVRVLPSEENAGKDLAIINIANSLPQSFVPFVAPFLLSVGSFGALFSFLAALGVLGAIAVVKVPEVGREHEGGITAVITRSETR